MDESDFNVLNVLNQSLQSAITSTPTRTAHAAHVTKQQKQLLIEFLSKNPFLVSGNFANLTKKEAQLLWCDFTKTLNSIPGGANKEWYKWRKTWQGIKKNTKAKAVKTRCHAVGTGGGAKSKETFSDFDKDVLDLMDTTCVDGNPNATESEVKFTYEYSDDENQQLQDDMQHESPENITAEESAIQPIIITVNDIESSAVSVGSPQNPGSTSASVDGAGSSKVVYKRPTDKKKRLTKSVRLSKSLSLTQDLLKISDKKNSQETNYRKRKLEILVEEQAARRAYEAKKLELLQANLETNSNILKALVAINNK